MNKKKRILIICAAGVVFLFALCLTIYPLFASSYSARHQAEIHTQYQQEVAKTDNTAIIEARKNAIRYNVTIATGVEAEDAFSGNALLAAEDSYGAQLNLMGNGIMGYVRVPKLSLTLPIYHGTADATLDLGVGHLLGSSLPVGGESTHAILTGHSGMASQKMFSDLPDMVTGDVFYLEILDETLAYQVDQIKTVHPYDTAYLDIEQGQDYCTLITCVPFGVNSHRLLVRGHRIPYVEEEEMALEIEYSDQPSGSTWERQYAKGLLIGLCLTLALAAAAAALAVIIKRRRKERDGKYAQKG